MPLDHQSSEQKHRRIGQVPAAASAIEAAKASGVVRAEFLRQGVDRVAHLLPTLDGGRESCSAQACELAPRQRVQATAMAAGKHADRPMVPAGGLSS